MTSLIKRSCYGLGNEVMNELFVCFGQFIFDIECITILAFLTELITVEDPVIIRYHVKALVTVLV